VVVYLLFSRHIYGVRISGMFQLRSIAGLVVSTEACGLQHSRQPVSRVLYIPFIHSRHNAKDRSLGMGRDVIVVCNFVCRLAVLDKQ